MPKPIANESNLYGDCDHWMVRVLRLLGEAGMNMDRATALRDALKNLIDARVALALAQREAERK
jgi:hypothetical protein